MIAALQGFLSWLPVGLPAFLFVILIVVFFHELGHFAVARVCGVTAEAFSIGFGPKIFGWKDRHGTMWKVSWLPLGGYVKFLGDMGAAATPDREKLDEMTPAEREGAFPLKPLHQRTAVVLAGPVANFILAILIFTIMFMTVGKPELSAHAIPAKIGSVTAKSPAAAAGLRAGDIVQSIQGQKVSRFEQLQNAIKHSGGKAQQFTVIRNGKSVSLRITPRWIDIRDIYGSKAKLFGIGVSPEVDPALVVTKRLGPIEAVGSACQQTWLIVDSTLTYVWRMVTGRADTAQLSGPVGIANISKKAASDGFSTLINLAALISVSIGLINLFPIPLLDGGHLLYYAFEAAAGRPLGERAQDMGFRLGLAVVLGLVIFVTWNDLSRLNLF